MRYKKAAIPPFVVVSLLCLEAIAQDLVSPAANLHRWGALTLFHGLPSNHVRAIAQDRDGTMWFGTDSGLARYAGRRVERVPGLPPGRVRALGLDSEGILWIGTDLGAGRLIGGQFKLVPETEGKSITAISTADSGRAFAASEQGFIFECRTNADRSVDAREVTPHDQPLLSLESSAGPPLLTSLCWTGSVLLVGTRSRGLLKVESGRVTEVLSRPRPFFVNAIESDGHGKVWLGAETATYDSGLLDIGDFNHPRKLTAPTGPVNALCLGGQGRLWVGTDGRGAFLFSEDQVSEHVTFDNTAGGLRSNLIYAVFVDREGVVWFGTDRGVSRYDPQGIAVETISTRPDSNFARTLYQSRDGRLWCGTRSGLFVRNKNQPGWREVRELANRAIHSLAEDAAGRLLVGTASGLYTGVNASTTRGPTSGSAAPVVGDRLFSRFPAGEVQAGDGSIRSIREFQGAFYIASFGRGVERISGERRVLIWPPSDADASLRKVTSLHACADGRLLIGTAGEGLFVFDGKQAARDSRYEHALAGATIWGTDGDVDSVLWLATSQGLLAFREEHWTRLLEGHDVRNVTAAGKSAWCVTASGGLFRVLLDDRAGTVISRLDTEQGLPSPSAFAILPTNEGLWVGTNRGVVRYSPTKVAPAVRFERVVGSRPFEAQELKSELVLDYPHRSVVVEATASSSRTFPEQFQYFFSVSDEGGLQISTQLSRESQFFVDHLKPGRYRIEAFAYYHDLTRSEPLLLDIYVAGAPFPWTTTALSVLLALAMAALVWGWVQNRRLDRSNKALAATRLQLANETESERRRIARDLHDQTLADLRRLLLLADELPSEAGTEAARFRGEVENISTEIRRICEDLSPSALENVGLSAALEWALTSAAAQAPSERRFDYEFECEDGFNERMKLRASEQIQVYRIVQEAVNNLCRHSGATRVRMSVSADNGQVLVTIHDNGRGFDPSSRDSATGRGLANIRSRASIIGAQVEWHSGTHGAVFTLRTRERS